MLPDNLKMSRCESLKTNQTMKEHLGSQCDKYGYITIRGGDVVAPEERPSAELDFDLVSTRQRTWLLDRNKEAIKKKKKLDEKSLDSSIDIDT